jgi:hypothetical protein
MTDEIHRDGILPPPQESSFEALPLCGIAPISADIVRRYRKSAKQVATVRALRTVGFIRARIHGQSQKQISQGYRLRPATGAQEPQD